MYRRGRKQVWWSTLVRNQSIDISNKMEIWYRMKVLNTLSADDVRSVVPSADLHRDQKTLYKCSAWTKNH